MQENKNPVMPLWVKLRLENGFSDGEERTEIQAALKRVQENPDQNDCLMSSEGQEGGESSFPGPDGESSQGQGPELDAASCRPGTSCLFACLQGCQDSCKGGSCQSACKGTCQSARKGACQSACKGACQSTCKLACQDYCQAGQCQYTCMRSCQDITIKTRPEKDQP